MSEIGLEKVLSCYITSNKKPTYIQVSNDTGYSIQEIKNIINLNKEVFFEVQTIRSLNNSIKLRSGEKYEFEGFEDFYLWYKAENKACCYCGVTSETLKKVWENGWRTKRRRGRALEVERIDTSNDNNKYNKSNCKLACYFCNNHKSDVISQEHYDEFFAKPMREYLEKISKMKKNNLFY